MNPLWQHRWLRAAVMGVALLAMIVSITQMVWLASRGASLVWTFPWSLLMWTSYYVGHFVATGKVIDESSRDTSISVPRSPVTVLLSVTSVAGMLIAFPIAIVAVNRDSYQLLFIAETCFVCGYVGGHYGLTRRFL